MSRDRMKESSSLEIFDPLFWKKGRRQHNWWGKKRGHTWSTASFLWKSSLKRKSLSKFSSSCCLSTTRRTMLFSWTIEEGQLSFWPTAFLYHLLLKTESYSYREKKEHFSWHCHVDDLAFFLSFGDSFVIDERTWRSSPPVMTHDHHIMPVLWGQEFLWTFFYFRIGSEMFFSFLCKKRATISRRCKLKHHVSQEIIKNNHTCIIHWKWIQLWLTWVMMRKILTAVYINVRIHVWCSDMQCVKWLSKTWWMRNTWRNTGYFKEMHSRSCTLCQCKWHTRDKRMCPRMSHLYRQVIQTVDQTLVYQRIPNMILFEGNIILVNILSVRLSRKRQKRP